MHKLIALILLTGLTVPFFANPVMAEEDLIPCVVCEDPDQPAEDGSGPADEDDDSSVSSESPAEKAALKEVFNNIDSEIDNKENASNSTSGPRPADGADQPTGKSTSEPDHVSNRGRSDSEGSEEDDDDLRPRQKDNPNSMQPRKEGLLSDKNKEKILNWADEKNRQNALKTGIKPINDDLNPEKKPAKKPAKKPVKKPVQNPAKNSAAKAEEKK